MWWNGWTNWARFGMAASFHLSYTMLKGNLGISKIMVLPSGRNFVQNSRLKKFCFSLWRSSKRVINVARERWMLQINWTVVDQLSRQYLRASMLNRGNISQWSSSSVTEKFRRVGLLATAAFDKTSTVTASRTVPLRQTELLVNQSRFFYSGLSNLNHCEVH